MAASNTIPLIGANVDAKLLAMREEPQHPPDDELAKIIAGRGESLKAMESAHAALELLYCRYAPRIFRYLVARVSDRTDAEDVHQEVWKKVWDKLPDFYHGGNFRAWIFAIARNTARDQNPRGLKLRLISPLHDMSGIPARGKNLMILAIVGEVLQIRIFGGEGQLVVDKDQKALREQTQQIDDLKKQLERLWPPHELNETEKLRVVSAVRSIVGYPDLGPTFGPQPPKPPPDNPRVRRLKHCLEKLKEPAASVVRERLAGKSYSEICPKLGITTNRAYKLYDKAKKQLKSCIERELL
jgi:RNA polymerase sigma factor (sigma-70 family)